MCSMSAHPLLVRSFYRHVSRVACPSLISWRQLSDLRAPFPCSGDNQSHVMYVHIGGGMGDMLRLIVVACLRWNVLNDALGRV